MCVCLADVRGGTVYVPWRHIRSSSLFVSAMRGFISASDVVRLVHLLGTSPPAAALVTTGDTVHRSCRMAMSYHSLGLDELESVPPRPLGYCNIEFVQKQWGKCPILSL